MCSGDGWTVHTPVTNLTRERPAHVRHRPDERYVATAWGRDYSDGASLKGAGFSGTGMHGLRVAVDAVRL